VTLSEKNFIHEEYPKHPWRIWGWLAIVIVCSLLFAWPLLQYSSFIEKQYAHSPFLQVTNRQISVFLWQNSEHMRVHAKNKSNYLPAFDYLDRVGLNPEYAEDYVVAPPELLFLFHNWNHFLRTDLISRSIPTDEFKNFLIDVMEWQPKYWPAAPPAYISLISELEKGIKTDLMHESFDTLPIEVRQAFTGWKNYFFEGDAINTFLPSYGLLKEFLKDFPHYTRPYWRNIYGLHYLKELEDNPDSIISKEYLSVPLRVALYNYSKKLR
jgi:hypothetical protein